MKFLPTFIFILFSVSFSALAGQAAVTHLSKVGSVFSLDPSHPALGEAYRDPQGLLWGDMVTYQTTVWNMTQYEAQDYCASLGARLPTKEEFRQLSMDLGFKHTQGYSPYMQDGKTEVIPNLVGHWYWSSSIFPFNSDNAYGFSGEEGYNDQMSFTGYIFREVYHGAVRCVISPSPK